MHVDRVKEITSALNILTGEPTGKWLLGKPRRKWENNIRVDLKEVSVNRAIRLIRLRIEILENFYGSGIQRAGFISDGVS